MPNVSPKTMIQNLVSLFRTEFENSWIKSGKQVALNIPDTYDSGLIIDFAGMPDAEESMGLGNNFWNKYDFNVGIFVKDYDNKADEVEDRKLDLIEQLQCLIADNRSLVCGMTGGTVQKIEIGITELDEKNKQRYRYADFVIRYQMQRTKTPISL